MKHPRTFASLVEALNTAGWDPRVTKGEDFAGHPFLVVEAFHQDRPRVYVTWHTRATEGKSYRLFTVLYGHSAMSLKALREEIKK